MSTPAVEWELSGFGDEIDDDPKIQIAVMQALGAKHIEVRSAWGTNIVDLDDAQLRELKSLLDAADMKVSAIASPIGKVDVSLPVEHEVERLRRAVNAAQVLESRYIRIFSFYYGEDVAVESIREAVIERMRALADVAEESGVVLLHENEKDIYGDIPERVLDIIETVASPALKVAWDAANFVQVGVKPFEDAYAKLRPHLEYLQVKDALFSNAHVVPAGEGDGDVLRTVEALKADGYTGFASLEPHLAGAHGLGGFSGPTAFGIAARAFAKVLNEAGVETK
ncbi:xylose isomerase domain protein TIM barrel [Arthrobacter sp. Hiyo8]|jgi:sugar phosphate isomerase/epimerase|uniref:sugar phosphate isomerase/epimerase family protein n=1 Tax=Arthrobacter TaxID=1663 RepID=UPI000683A458|nr:MULTISPECIES: sugar phosphate isomerase/epimerase family protein [Arthrobacter]MDQ0238816.1 sugar phosphate isomerase/epimerase [Arthrobacter bambusae]BAS14684.1 xylose isomerase domain protein TIM barrel [Arthrobacter sp. Hiyo8]GAP59013.1 xylose isomerase domain protein TIM barrel [Arthrobacter sp. Hiyo1]